MRKTIILLTLSSFVLWLTVFIVLNLFSYELITGKLFSILHIEIDRQAVYRNILTASTFYQMKWLACILAIASGLFLLMILKYPTLVKTISNWFLPLIAFPKWIVHELKACQRLELWLLAGLFALILVQRVFLIVELPVVYDEAWTYLSFTSKNPLVAACFYPASNNHILFSHLTHLTKLLPWNILVNLRISAFLPGMLSLLVFYFCLKRYVGLWPLLLSTLMLAMSFPMLYYGVIGRGYSLMTFFFALGFFSTLKLLKQPDNANVWRYLTLSNIFGLYTIPTYLYPFIGLNGFLLVFLVYQNRKSEIKLLLKSATLSLCCVFVLYLPVFIVSGIASVVSNKFVLSMSYPQIAGKIPSYFGQTVQFITGFKGVLVPITMVSIIGLGYFLIKMRKEEKIFPIFLLLTPILFIGIQRVLPVERTWVYLMVPLAFYMGLLLESIKFRILCSMAVALFITLNIMHLEKNFLWYNKASKQEFDEGCYFSNRFHTQKLSLWANGDLVTYLEFNQLLYNEPWMIHTGEFLPDTEFDHVILDVKRDPKRVDEKYALSETYLDYKLYSPK